MVDFSWDWERRITARYEHDPWVMEVAPRRVPAHGPVYYELPRPVRKASWAPGVTYSDVPDFNWRVKFARAQIPNLDEGNHP